MLKLQNCLGTRSGTDVAVIHCPADHPPSVILVAPTREDAKRVLASLNGSGVDWSQPHTAATHLAMRAAIVAATSDGTATEDM